MTTTTTPTTDVPVLDDDPFRDADLRDPGRFQAALRDAGPLVHLPALDAYAVGRYADVHAVLRDWQDFESRSGVGLSSFRREKPWRPPSLLLEADPPHHDAPRAVLATVLGPRALRRLRETWFTDAEALVDDLLGGGTVELDAVPALAEAFPLRVFPDAVGLPAEGRENLLPYGDTAFNAFGPDNALRAKGAPRVAELSAWVAGQCARDVLTDDGFGAAIWAASDRGDITPAQAPLVVRSLLTAGVDTTVHGIGALLACLARTPGAWERLRADPSQVRVAFDEAVRLESPVQMFFRTADRDVTVGEHVVPEGEKVLVCFAAANRDPRHWERPDAFDLDRDPSGHVGFGMGLHQCVGQHVARLEAEALVTALLRRVATLEPAGPGVRHLNNTLRAWESLPLRLTPA